MTRILCRAACCAAVVFCFVLTGCDTNAGKGSVAPSVIAPKPTDTAAGGNTKAPPPPGGAPGDK